MLLFVAQLRRRGGATCDDVGEGGVVSLLGCSRCEYPEQMDD